MPSEGNKGSEKERYQFDVYKLEEQRKDALKRGEEFINREYVDRILKEFEDDVKSETIPSYKKRFGRRLKYFFRERPWIKEIVKYSLYPAAVLSAYYFGVDRIFDHFYIGLESEAELASKLAETYNYIEFMPREAVEITNSFAKTLGRPQVEYPIKFTLLNPKFANVTSFFLGLFLGRYFVNKRQYARALFVPFVAGLSISVSYLALIPYLSTWYYMLESLRPEVFNSVPEIIKKLIFELANANPLESSRGLFPSILSLSGSLLSGVYSFWKRKREISERYNV